MPYDKNNIFAKILRGEIPCDKVHETKHTLAFRDIAPKAPVHILVIPKGDYISSADFNATASPEEIEDFSRSVNHVVTIAGIIESGYRIVVNTGRDAGQEVPHLHVHILGGGDLGPLC